MCLTLWEKVIERGVRVHRQCRRDEERDQTERPRRGASLPEGHSVEKSPTGQRAGAPQPFFGGRSDRRVYDRRAGCVTAPGVRPDVSDSKEGASTFERSPERIRPERPTRDHVR